MNGLQAVSICPGVKDMEEDKRKIIVKEIERWRRNKMLPEHYCDFLLNLYLDERTDSSGPAASTSLLRSASITGSRWKLWLLFIVSISLISFTVLHFNSFPVVLQIGLSLFFVVACFGTGVYMRRRQTAVSYLAVGAGTIFMLFIGLYLLKDNGLDTALWLLGYLLACSLAWIVIGLLMDIPLLQFCGWAGLTLLYAWALDHRSGDAHWAVLEACWLPLSILFGWLAWAMHHWRKSSAIVLFLVSSLLWFMPEIQALYRDATLVGLTQGLLFGKMALGGLIVFVLRKKWIAWVA